MNRRCETEATLSAFVDDALSGAERDRVAAHLAECHRCATEVAGLRRVQRLLSAADASRRRPDNPQLADRLVSIAGGQADQPLWTRPFDRPLDTRAPLPSIRRARRRNLGSAVVVLATVMMGLVGVGWAAAPPPDIEIVNPAAKARAEFGHVAAQRPFVMDSTIAVWAMPQAEQQAFTGGGTIERLPVTAGTPLDAEEARTVLRAGEAAPRVVDHTSRERARVQYGDGQVQVDVDVQHHAGQGTQVGVLSGNGKMLRTAFLPTRGDEALPVPADLSGRRDQMVVGRPATLVEARRDNTLIARWWFDKRTGLQLAQETYAGDGTVLVQAVVTRLHVDRKEFLAHTPPRLVRPVAAAYLQLTDAPAVRARGWSCHQELAGLPLTRLGTDPGTSVNTTYSDGASAITVRQERGTIVEAPEGFAWDDKIGAYRRDGSPTMMIWQSKDSVFTVVTDGSPELATEAVGELPHEPPVLRTRVGRVQAGWQHLVETVAGR